MSATKAERAEVSRLQAEFRRAKDITRNFDAAREFLDSLSPEIRETLEGLEEVTDTLDERIAIKKAQREAERAPQPILTRMSTVQPEPVRWLWHRRIAQGKLTLLVGDPGVSKSTLSIDIVARVTRGLPFPDGGQITPSNVVMLTAEDGLADTVRPRLELAGADLTRVDVLEGVRRRQKVEEFDLRDIPMLAATIEARHPALVTIDPTSAYIGEKTDSNRDSAVRSVLGPLAKLAERHMVAILGVGHLNKSQQQQIIHRVGGSIGFVGAARSVLAAVADPDNEDRRIIGRIKGNLGRPPQDLAYEIVDHGDSSAVKWLEGPAPTTVKSVLFRGFAENDDERGALADAIDYLGDVLKNGRVRAKEVLRGADECGITKRTLYRAKSDLRVESVGVPDEKGKQRWYWGLRETAAI